MRVAILSTYSPTQCGIATFSADLYGSLRAVPGVDVAVLALTDGPARVYPPPVVSTVASDVRTDYRRAAELVARLGVDVVMIQHEFGIYGGPDGDYVLDFIGALTVPYVVTLHTVSSELGANQEWILRELCRKAASVMVFTDTAKSILLSRGTAQDDRVQVVPHGAPPEICELATALPRSEDCERFVLSSFGLISPGKGIEMTLDAIARVVEQHPEVLFVIAGQTHPTIARRDGEVYRNDLQERVQRLGLAEHVRFEDRFLSVPELARLLASTDLFITAYKEREQIVSGALTFAIAAGCPVISTPYRYAEDLLKSGAGLLVPFGDAVAMADAITTMIENPDRLEAARTEAQRIGSALSWPAVAEMTSTVLRDAAATMTAPGAMRPVAMKSLDAYGLPPLRLDQLRTLVDDVGIIQHANGAVPNRYTGYCVDDVARLIQVSVQLADLVNDPYWLAVTVRGLAFLDHAVEPDEPGMRNFMSYDRQWLDEPHHGDHVGRAMWALGDLLAAEPPPAIAVPTTVLMERIADGYAGFEPTPRNAMYTLLGLARVPEGNFIVGREQLIDELAAGLVALHTEHSRPEWDWFEPRITYDNARMSQSLIVAGQRLGNQHYLDVGLRTLEWFGNECCLDGPIVHLPGNQGRNFGEPHRGHGDEQPLDAAALVEAEIDALRATGRPEHGQRALKALSWFFGANRLGIAVYDATNGGCCDGLKELDTNPNQGAESTLTYHMARLSFDAARMLLVRDRTLDAA
jgi:glycosyltransferase involved in cell wall biosynthesis